MKQRITVIGSSNVDMIMKLSHLPAKGETVTEGAFMQVFGGKGANQAVAAARAGGSVTFVTAVGDEPYGHIMLENFRKEGMDTSHALMVEGVPSGTALIMLDQEGANYLAVASGANYSLLPVHIEALTEIIRDSALLVMQREVPNPTVQKALDIAEREGVPVLFNYAPAHPLELPVSAQMTGLAVNEVEAEMLTGVAVTDTAQAQKAAEALLALGAKYVILTLGKEGAYVATEGVRQLVPTFPVTPVDTTAAGDTFSGALAVALVEGKPLLEAVRFANAAAALSVTRMGAQPSVPSRAEIEAFLSS